jgi:hypothetical protein
MVRRELFGPLAERVVTLAGFFMLSNSTETAKIIGLLAPLLPCNPCKLGALRKLTGMKIISHSG